MQLLSALADIGFVIPIMVVALTVLMIQRDLQTAGCWGGAVLLTIIVVSVIKKLLHDDPILPHFPSGHVALAVAFYGGFVLLLGQNHFVGSSLGLIGAVAMLATIALVEGVSRVALTHHTWVDVGGGFFFGASALLVAGFPWAWKLTTVRSRIYVLLGSAFALLPDIMLAPQLDGYIRRIVEL